jgi:hypothetical protein
MVTFIVVRTPLGAPMHRDGIITRLKLGLFCISPPSTVTRPSGAGRRRAGGDAGGGKGRLNFLYSRGLLCRCVRALRNLLLPSEL